MTGSRHTLLLVRHAKSDWSVPAADRDRPLAPRGRRQAPEAGRWVADHLEPVDLAVVSPAARARETWSLISAELRSPPKVRLDDDVYAAWADELLDVVRGLPEDAGTVALVAHNPGMEDLVTDLAGRYVPMPTSALAVLDVEGPWSRIGPEQVTLRSSGRPPPT